MRRRCVGCPVKNRQALSLTEQHNRVIVVIVCAHLHGKEELPGAQVIGRSLIDRLGERVMTAHRYLSGCD